MFSSSFVCFSTLPAKTNLSFCSAQVFLSLAQHETKFLRQDDQMPKSIFPTISENVGNENVLVVKFVFTSEREGKVSGIKTKLYSTK